MNKLVAPAGTVQVHNPVLLKFTVVLDPLTLMLGTQVCAIDAAVNPRDSNVVMSNFFFIFCLFLIV
jgi:hypothetical protein